jgi:hypothetical protein
MKFDYIKSFNLVLCYFVILSLTSCAQEVKNVPDYDFNRDYDLNDIINFYQKIDRPDVDKVLEIIKKHTIIGFSWIEAPLGQVTLFKSDNAICAIRIINFKRGLDKKAATTFDSGNETFFAEYEMSTQFIKESVTASNEKLKIIRGKLTKNSTFGVGRLAFGGGDFTLMCGNEKLYWSFPTAISIPNNDSKIKFSPTSIKSLNVIDYYNKKNIWYGYEENREMIILGNE